MDRVNIVYIGSDQHRFDCLGLNGHPQIQTPNLDRLTASGINFANAYTPCPVCTPARASLLTGQWSYQHAALTIPQMTEAHRTYLSHLKTVPEVLRDAGYVQGYVGKWHVADRSGHPQPEELGFGEYVPEGRYERWRGEQEIPPGPRGQTWASAANSPKDFDRMIRGAEDEHISPDQSRLHWGADHAIRMIESAAAGGEPFFVRWDPSEPHPANVVPQPYASMYDPRELEPWGSFAEEFSGKPYIQRQQLESWGIAHWTWDDWAPVVARYLGEISLLDHEIGRVIEAVERCGRGDSTVIIYTTDHGDLCGSHRMMDKHFVMYDDIVRVPLIIGSPAGRNTDSPSATDGWSRGSVYRGFVSHAIDLASTLCELAGVDPPDTFQGRSLVPVLRDEPDANGEPRSDIISAYHGGQFGLFSQRMVRDHEWKYVWNPTAVDELYHMTEDPWELVNLGADPAFADQLHRLRVRLADWMRKTDDPLLNPWTQFQLLHGRKLP